MYFVSVGDNNAAVNNVLKFQDGIWLIDKGCSPFFLDLIRRMLSHEGYDEIDPYLADKLDCLLVIGKHADLEQKRKEVRARLLTNVPYYVHNYGFSESLARAILLEEQGVASLTMIKLITGYVQPGNDTVLYQDFVPVDVDSFKRCLNLYRNVKEIQEGFHKLASHPKWRGFVEHWEELTKIVDLKNKVRADNKMIQKLYQDYVGEHICYDTYANKHKVLK